MSNQHAQNENSFNNPLAIAIYRLYEKKKFQGIQNHLNSLGKSKSLSKIKNHVDNFNSEQILQ